MTAAEALQTVLALLGKSSASADPEAELGKLAYQAAIVVLKVKGLEKQLEATREIHEGLRYANETKDTSLLETAIRKHFSNTHGLS